MTHRSALPVFLALLASCGEALVPECQGVAVVEKATGAGVLATAQEATNGIMQGRYEIRGAKQRVIQSGRFGTVATEDFVDAFNQGAALADPAQSKETPRCNNTPGKLRAHPPTECTWCAKD